VRILYQGTLKLNKYNLVLVFGGIISSIYWFLLIVQDATHNNYSERTADFSGILHISVMLFQGITIIRPTLSYAIQVVCFVGSWLVFYGVVKLLRRN